MSNHNPCAIDHIGVFVGINHWVNPITGLPELQWRPHTSSTKDYPVFYHQQTWGIPLPYSSTKGVHLCEATYPVWWLQPATQVNINYMSTTLWLQSSIALSYCLSLSLWLNWISTSLSITPIYSVLIYLTSKNKSQLGSLTCSDFFFQISWILDTFGHVSCFFTHPMIHVAFPPEFSPANSLASAVSLAACTCSTLALSNSNLVRWRMNGNDTRMELFIRE